METLWGLILSLFLTCFYVRIVKENKFKIIFLWVILCCLDPLRGAARLAAEDPGDDVGGVQLRGYLPQQWPGPLPVHHICRLDILLLLYN